MKKMNNRTIVEGYLYSNSLVERTYSDTAKRPGAKYIMGTVDIATDEDLLNVISVHFSFVSEPQEKDKPIMKQRYETLANIMNGTIKSCLNDGKDVAAKLQISSAIGLNEFYSERNGVEELVSVKRNEGGFIRSQSPLNDPNDRNTFDTDMIIISAKRVEADEERDTPEKVIIGGYIFDFRGAIMPVEYTVLAPGAMNYFEGLEPTKKNPVFTRVKGHQISTTVTRKIVEESAFGDDRVREVKNSRKDWVVDWAQKEEYEFDDESTITAEEINNALADRDVMLSDMKNRRKNSTNAIPDEAPASNPTKGKYTIKKSTDAFDF